MKMHAAPLFVGMAMAAAPAFAGEGIEPWPHFKGETVDASMPRAYQVAAADIDGDGKIDLAALGEGEESGIVWYENPSWKKRPISGGETSRHIDMAFHDLDGDGELELAVASGFGLGDSRSGGQISWFDRGEDLDAPWTAHPIHAEPTAHRVRWANVRGDLEKELIVLPIVGPGSKGPEFNQEPVRLLSFQIPGDPVADAWPMEVVDRSLRLAHGLFVLDNPVLLNAVILTAGEEGITLFEYAATGKDEWSAGRLHEGRSANGGRRGSSEVAAGRLINGEHFIVSIDPWHGNELAVYTSDGPDRVLDRRTVIDDSLVNGHALACADFDGDGEDEIAAGYRGEGHSIYLYDRPKRTENAWKRYLVDRDVAAQGFAAADLNGDGMMDLAAAGGATNNVKVYINTAKPAGMGF